MQHTFKNMILFVAIEILCNGHEVKSLNINLYETHSLFTMLYHYAKNMVPSLRNEPVRNYQRCSHVRYPNTTPDIHSMEQRTNSWAHERSWSGKSKYLIIMGRDASCMHSSLGIQRFHSLSLVDCQVNTIPSPQLFYLYLKRDHMFFTNISICQ